MEKNEPFRSSLDERTWRKKVTGTSDMGFEEKIVGARVGPFKHSRLSESMFEEPPKGGPLFFNLQRSGSSWPGNSSSTR